jgi:AcrR family transcriptional regulator
MFKKHSSAGHAPGPHASKGIATRQHVLDTALTLFRRQGFAGTTMRDIASAAGLSLGAAYHYFPSKDAIVMAYYEWMQREHERLVEARRSPDADLKARMATLFATKLELLRQDRKLLGALFGNMGDPTHPLSVLGRQTADIRARSLAQFTALFADPAVADELRPLLGRLLWLAHLGIFLFFIHDDSPKQARTFRLVETVVDLAASAVPLLSHPFAGPVRRRIVELMSYLDGGREATA